MSKPGDVPRCHTESRRRFMQSALALAGGALTAVIMKPLKARTEDAGLKGSQEWDQLPQILKRIQPPVFADRQFEITKFGALGDNRFDCTSAVGKAIAACSAAGGGTVLVPKGDFLTGAIRLKSNVNLRVAEGGTIRFSRDPAKYPLVLTRWEGVELMNFSPFIYAFGEEDIAVTGSGTIDGNADCEHWWPWKGRSVCGAQSNGPNQERDRNQLFAMAEQNVPVQQRIFGEGHYLRPQFIQPYRCKNVLIEGVTLVNSPMWQVHPVLSTNVSVRGLTISASGPNTDGCDPESCTDVLIENCLFDTGDDCIAIKSGRNADGRRVNQPCQNIIVRGCRMKDGHGGVTIGSEDSGGVRNVFAEDCQMDSPNLDNVVRIKNNAMRGGVVENIYVRNIQVGQVRTAALSVDFYYEEANHGEFKPVARNINISDLQLKSARRALDLRGFPDAPIENVTLKNCRFADVKSPDVIEHVNGLTLDNVEENGTPVHYPIS